MSRVIPHVRIRLLAMTVAILGLVSSAVGGDDGPPAKAKTRREDALPPGAVARLGTLLLRHDARLITAAFSPDGKVIVALDEGRRLRFWDSISGQQLHEVSVDFKSSYFSVFDKPAVVFSNDGRVVAVAAAREVAIVAWKDNSMPRLLPQQEDEVHGLLFAGGSLIGHLRQEPSCHPGGTRHGQSDPQLDSNHDKVPAVAFSRDGKTLAVGCTDDFIRLWDLENPKKARKLFCDGWIYASALAFSPDGNLLAWGNWKGIVHIVDLVTGKEIKAFQVCESGFFESPFAGLQFTSAGVLLALGRQPAVLSVWQTGKELVNHPIQPLGEHTLYGRLSPDGKRVLFWTENSVGLRFLNVETGREEELAAGHWKPVFKMAASPDSKTLASNSSDGTIRLWDLQTGRELRRWEPHGFWGARDIAWSPDGKVLASCAADIMVWRKGTVRLWDPETGREVRKWETEANTRLAFARAGTKLFAAGHSRVQVWDAATGKLIREMEEIPEAKAPPFQIDEMAPKIWWAFYELAVSPDGKVVAAEMAKGGRRVYLWDVASGKRLPGWPVKELEAPLAFSPDGEDPGNRKKIQGEGERLQHRLVGRRDRERTGSHSFG